MAKIYIIVSLHNHSKISGDYQLFNIVEDTNNNKEIINIKTAVSVKDNNDDLLLGYLTMGHNGKYDGLAFFEFDNKALYTPFSIIGNEKHNWVGVWNEIANEIGLEFNNITFVEIALDTTYNIIKKTRKFITNINDYIMYINGNIISDDDDIPDYCECFGRKRKKLNGNPTLYFRQKKSCGLGLKMYDKTREIAKTNKQYILDWLNYGKRNIYRAEVVVRNVDFADFAAEKGHNRADLQHLLIDDTFLAQLWESAAKRLFSFRNRHTR